MCFFEDMAFYFLKKQEDDRFIQRLEQLLTICNGIFPLVTIDYENETPDASRKYGFQLIILWVTKAGIESDEKTSI